MDIYYGCVCPIPISLISLDSSNFYNIDERAPWYLHPNLFHLFDLILWFCQDVCFSFNFLRFLLLCYTTVLDFQISWINELWPNFPLYCVVLIYVYNSTVLLFLTDFDDDDENKICLSLQPASLRPAGPAR